MADAAIVKNHICPKCKLCCDNSDRNTNTLCCSKCFNWYHYSCQNFKGPISTTNKFKCDLCLSKTNCHACQKKYYPRSLRVNCINCSHSFCSKCAAQTGKNIKFYLSPNNDFFVMTAMQIFHA